jgi:hypothetical protein
MSFQFSATSALASTGATPSGRKCAGPSGYWFLGAKMSFVRNLGHAVHGELIRLE